MQITWTDKSITVFEGTRYLTDENGASVPCRDDLPDGADSWGDELDRAIVANWRARGLLIPLPERKGEDLDRLLNNCRQIFQND